MRVNVVVLNDYRAARCFVKKKKIVKSVASKYFFVGLLFFCVLQNVLID